MSIRLNPAPSFADSLKTAERTQYGLWVCSTSPTVAEICAGSGIDWLLIDAEHTPNDLQSILSQLQAVHGYPVQTVVRPPSHDANLIKQYLDLGVQNLLIPMVNTADQARDVVRAVSYPPLGIRGVGSALARASQWNRIENYLQRAETFISVVVQIETEEAVRNLDEILAVPGIAGVFIGPSDLAASMGLLGQQDHPDVVSSVRDCITRARAADVKVGVNAFAPATADAYVAAGADFVLVGADVALLARSTEAIVDRFISRPNDATERSSY
ncbi:MAG: HpcH/HpaI aldolase family protein [Microbacteriaceae bacterium]